MEQNYKERAARAERVCADLDAALARILPFVNYLQSMHAYADVVTARDQWAAHQADYDTLDQAAARPPVA